MGFDGHAIRFLLSAKRRGVDFSKVMMIGRQGLHVDSYYTLKSAMVCFGMRITDREAERILTEHQGYAEHFFRTLGAIEVQSVDASDYEKASIVHDMNLPISDDLKNRFTVVIDGGSLEHVFNFPQAIKNCMEMVCCGGHFLGITPANNWMGHGFYQFSPELYFRVFTEENGFSLERLLLMESSVRPRFFEVEDPKAVGKRVEIINKSPTLLMIQAKRVSTGPILMTAPQQSDYVGAWNAGKAIAGTTLAIGRQPSAARERIKRIIPRPVQESYRSLRGLYRRLLLWMRLRYHREGHRRVSIVGEP